MKAKATSFFLRAIPVKRMRYKTVGDWHEPTKDGLLGIDVADMDHTDFDDPGTHPQAPYYDEHQTATDIEAIVSRAMNIDWIKYVAAQEKVMKGYKKKK